MFSLVLLAAVSAPSQDVQLMPPAKVKAFRGLLPVTSDATLRELYKKPLIFYTESEIPRAYYLGGGLKDAYKNISAAREEPFGNVNREFPWGHPAGTHRAENVFKFNFMHLPSPITYRPSTLPLVVVRSSADRKVLQTRDEAVVRWKFPKGTTFGEVLFVQDPDGVRRPFDLRIRTKVGDGNWRVDAFRPVLTGEELRKFLREMKADTKAFEAGTTVKVDRLASDHPLEVVFDRKAAVESLGPLPPDVVTKLLRKPFRSAVGIPWTTHKGVEGFAPTTSERYSIVPKGYDGAYLPVTRKACMTCHDGAMKKQADSFDMKRDWYGRLRGDDDIFSFHPASKEAIHGFDDLPFSPNEVLLKAGLLKKAE